MEKMIFFNKKGLLFFLLVNIFMWIPLILLSRLGAVSTIGGLPYPRIAFYILGIYLNCTSIGFCCLTCRFVVVDEKNITLKAGFKRIKSIEWKDVKTIEEVVVDEKRDETYYFIFDGTEEEINKKNGYQSKKTPIKILKTSKSMIWFEHYLDNQKKNSINDN